ncbi:MAG: phage major capsid protein [Gammaproteobacteria bacterium]|nr:phage major capsid protein [Gammaproteobacteria bacterium]MDH3372506.1 phage major capsid protein [Gammaproteobacteria bacterium]
MSTKTSDNVDTPSRRQRKMAQASVLEERERISAINFMATKYGHRDLADQFIEEGRTSADFGQVILDKMPGAQPTIEIASTHDVQSQLGYGRAREPSISGLTRGELAKYSLVRAIRATTDPKAQREAGFEIDVSRALAKQLNRSTQGLLIPMEALSTRVVQKGGSGVNLVPEEFLAGEFVDVLRAKSAVMSQNVRILDGLQGDVVIPRKTASASVGWIAGDGGDSLTADDPTFDQITLSPNTVGGLTVISHRMLHQSSPGIEQLVREDLAATIATEIDSAAISADGTGNQPTGILNTSGITGLTYPNATLPGFTDIVALESNLDADNAAQGALSYILTPSLKGALKTTDKGTDTGQFVFEQTRDGGRMNGYPALASSSVPAGYVLFANWQDFLVGMWGVLEILSDPYGSNFASGSVSVRALLDIDFGVRHPESFAELHEAP